jgi:hypothetical protein
VPFSIVDLTWRRWVEAWDREHAGARPASDFLEGYSILPRNEPPTKGDIHSSKQDP